MGSGWSLKTNAIYIYIYIYIVMSLLKQPIARAAPYHDVYKYPIVMSSLVHGYKHPIVKVAPDRNYEHYIAKVTPDRDYKSSIAMTAPDCDYKIYLVAHKIVTTIDLEHFRHVFRLSCVYNLSLCNL